MQPSSPDTPRQKRADPASEEIDDFETPKKARRPPKLSIVDLSDAVKSLAPLQTPLSRHQSRANSPERDPVCSESFQRRKLTEAIFGGVAKCCIATLKEALSERSKKQLAQDIVNHRDDDGYSPLLCAVSLTVPSVCTGETMPSSGESVEKIVDLLLSAGADVMQKDW